MNLKIDILVMAFDVVCSHQYKLSMDALFCFGCFCLSLISCFCFVSRFDFFADLQTKLQNPAKVVSVFDKVQMQGDKGAVATVDLSIGKFIKTTVNYIIRLIVIDKFFI